MLMCRPKQRNEQQMDSLEVDEARISWVALHSVAEFPVTDCFIRQYVTYKACRNTQPVRGHPAHPQPDVRLSDFLKVVHAMK
jgi:hypothetical protein